MANKRLLKAIGANLPSVAQMLQDKGRGKDKILAHITPGEAVMLKIHGGRGSRHPETGLLEFDDTPETVTVNAPAPPSPTITAPSPVVSAPARSNNAPETVTVTGQAPSGPAVAAPPPIIPLSAPTVSAPTVPGPAAAPQGNAAPEVATVTGSQALPAIPSGVNGIERVSQPVPGTPTETTGQELKNFLSNNSTALSIGGLGALGVLGTLNNARASKQGAALEGKLSNLAAPLTTAGTGELNATLAGGLTPARLQALQAISARLGQSQAMGAVSSQQVAQSISDVFAQQLQDQLQEALNILNTADGYLQSAYVDGYNANVSNQANTTNFYTNLASLAARMAGLDTGTPAKAGAA